MRHVLCPFCWQNLVWGFAWRWASWCVKFHYRLHKAIGG
jgi:hypothetical protein